MKKVLKSVVSVMLAVMMTVGASVLPVSADQEILGSVISTDIMAFINGYEVPTYNVDGNLIVVGADLRNYGFDVVYDNDARTSRINYTGEHWNPGYLGSEETEIGKKLMDVYSTDIKVIVNGAEVLAYNVEGRMAFKFSELKVYGNYYYDNMCRSAFLDINKNQNEQQKTVIKKQEDKTPSNSSVTERMSKAAKAARDTVNYTTYSYSELIELLKLVGYSDAEAKYGAENCGVSWKEMALEDAIAYTKANKKATYDELYNNLKSRKYTDSEAKYGAENCGVDWDERAEKASSGNGDSYVFSISVDSDGIHIFDGRTSSDKKSDKSEGVMVWIPQTGSKYHRNPDCSGMRKPLKVSKSEAIAAGFDPCEDCY